MEKIDRRDRLKDLMRRHLITDGFFNLKKVVNTFGGNNPILREVVLEWINEGIQRMKSITPTSEAQAKFIQIFDGAYADVWFEKYPFPIFFLKGDPNTPETWFELTDSLFHCNYDRVWAVLKNEYSLGYAEIRHLIKTMMEEAFKLKGVTPCDLFSTAY